MQLIRIEFQISNVFKEKQVLELNKKNICLIGANASGKSTYLKALHSVTNRFHSNRSRYFKLNEASLVYTINRTSKIHDLLFINKNIDLEVVVNKDNYSNYFFCPWLSDEFVFLEKELKDAYKKFYDYIEYIKVTFEEYCSENDIVLINCTTIFSHILGRESHYLRELNNLKVDFKEKVLSEDIRFRELYHIHHPQYLIAKTGNLEDDDRLNIIKEFFSDFLIKGKPTHIKRFDEFEKQHKYIMKELIKKIDNFNNLVDDFNNIFSRHSKLYTYLNEKVTNKTIMLDHTNSDNVSKFVIDNSLRVFSEKIYNSILGFYEDGFKEISTKHKLFDNLKILNVLPQKIQDSEYEEASKNIDNLQNILEDDKDQILLRLKKYFSNQDIIKDFNSNFDKYYYIPDMDSILSLITSFIKEIFPNYINMNIKDIVIELDDKDKYQMYILNNKQINLDDLSSGTKWSLMFSILKYTVNDNDIFLIDEPALFLHKTAQRSILDELLELNCYVIYSTHTPTLLPINLNDMRLFEVKKSDGSSYINEIDNNVNEMLIDSFGVRHLKKIFVDYKRKVVLIENGNKHFFTMCENHGIKIDVPVLKGVLNENIIMKLNNIFSDFGIQAIVVVSKLKDYIKLSERLTNISIYQIADLEMKLKNHKNQELTYAFRGLKDE